MSGSRSGVSRSVYPPPPVREVEDLIRSALRDSTPMLGVTVVGSVNVDFVVACARIPRPGETVAGRSLTKFLGGKGANQAVAASRTAEGVVFFATVGDDESGHYVRDQLKLSGLSNSRIFVASGTPTGTAFITVDDSGNNSIVVVPGANDCWAPDAADGLTQPTICVSQFEIPLETIRRYFSRNRQLGGRNILNPAPFAEIPMGLLTLADFLVLNETEYLQFRSMEGQANSLSLIRNDLKNLNLAVPIIVTLGDQGVLFKLGDAAGFLPAHRVNVVDSTGAGDCFVGVYSALLSKDYADVEAIRLANAAAAVSVTRSGAAASMPTLSEILEFARSQESELMSIQAL